MRVCVSMCLCVGMFPGFYREGVLARLVRRVCAAQLFGPFLISTPVGPLRRQRLCSRSAHFWAPEKAGVRGAPKAQCACSLRAVQLFGHLAVVQTHTLWYFGHQCCLVVGFDALDLAFMDVHPGSLISTFLHTFFAHFHHMYSSSRLIDMVIHFEGACYRTSYFPPHFSGPISPWISKLGIVFCTRSNGGASEMVRARVLGLFCRPFQPL